MGIETIKPREVERLLRKGGWRIKSSRGSHEKWEHPVTKQYFVMASKGSRRNNPIHMNTAKHIIAELKKLE